MAINYTTQPYVLETTMYRSGTVDAPILGPTRAFYQDFSQNAQLGWWENVRAQRIPPGIAQTARILIVGCGFGFLIEKLRAAGFQNVWGIDLSPYYFEAVRAANFGAGIRALIQQFNVVGMTSQMRRTLTGSTTAFDAVITESVMESYTPAEQDQILAACEAQRVATNRPIYHLVFDGTDMTPLGGCPARTLAEWQASTVRAGHTFISAVGVAGGVG